MICEVDGAVSCGRTVTLCASADPETVARAVREGIASDGQTTVRVRARRPHAVHERVGAVHPEMGLRPRTALAEAARARGLSTPFDDEIRARAERLADLTIEDVETADQRQAVAAASTETERLREEVAQTRGELIARRDRDDETDGVAERFRDAARELSEAETTAVTARQNLTRRRREARAVRDRLEQRLALEDDLANLRRQARAALVDRVRDAYACAVEGVPGGPARVTDPFDVDAVTAALAVARIAAFDAPVVLACDRFPSARAASAWLATPVIRVSAR
ncbi:hypothetical protein [Salinibaculum rarum]|uniref:DUF7856 family protein n=1 Tax=Salinibaculum rarum TaxID=3058903 RepID=UPI00265FC5AA|nr:hypothetical protein [Salinibaculum sp. KK48]